MRFFFAFLLALGSTRGAIKVEGWTPIFQGVEVARGEADATELRLQKVVVIRVDLRAEGVEFFSSPRSALPPWETTSETTSEFLRHYHLQVAINANFYAPCCAAGEKDLIGLAVSRGAVVSPPKEQGNGSRALTITRANHAAVTATSGGFRTQDVWTAVAGSEIVLKDGMQPKLADNEFNRTPHPRTAVGVTKDGRYLLLMTIDGRQPGYSVGATMNEVADWLQRFGASEGLNLDGGGSTALVRDLAGKPDVLNQPSGVALGSSDNTERKGGERLQRSNGNNLGLFAKPLPVAR